MPLLKFYLDTDALNRLSCLNGNELEEFKSRFNSLDAELVFTHVQVDERDDRYSTKFGAEYQGIVEKALTKLESKGIKIRVEPTKIAVMGYFRWGYSVLSTPDVGRVYAALEREISACEQAKGNTKKKLANIRRDAIIAVSPLEYSFLITTDKCQCDSFNKVVEENKEIVEKMMTPEAKLATQSPKGVADCILSVLSNK
jgi:hypothetical protein